jgi:hypothetical protein
VNNNLPTEATEPTPTAAPTCPVWCELAPDHGWDSVSNDGQSLSCGHGRTVGTFLDGRSPVEIVAIERHRPGEEPVTEHPALCVSLREGTRLTAGQARKLAELLDRGAHELDHIGGAR